MPAERRAGLPTLLGALTFWLLYWGAGFPLPNWDDLFFIGGAIELARSGELTNPLLRFWNPVAADRYFFQTPFYPFALAGWIETFGLGARSLLAFQAMAGAAFSVCAILLLRRYTFSGGLALPVILAFAVAPQGLRHDAMGLALLATGLWFLSHEDAVRSFTGALLLSCAVATWPVLLGYALPFGLAITLGGGRRTGTSSNRHAARRLGICLGGAAAAMLLLLVSIRFRLTEFLQDFIWHARLRRPPLGRIFQEIGHQLTNGYAELLYGPFYLVLLLLGVTLVTRWRQLRPEARVFLVALGTGTAATVFLYSSMLHPVIDLFCGLGLFILLGELPVTDRTRRIAAAVAISAFALTQSHFVLGLARRSDTPPERYEDARMLLRSSPPTLLGVDEIAARFVFDYRLPPGAFFWNYSAPPQKTWPASTEEKPAGVTWVVSPAKSQVTQGIPSAGTLKLFGRSFGSMPARARDVVVIQ